MKKIILMLTVFLLLMGIQLKVSAEPDISAQSGIVIEYMSGTVLFEKNIREKLPMASTTKIMTALIAAENGDMNAVMTVSEEAASVDGSQMGLLPDQTLTMEDLMYMMLLKSANDAAEVIAENICGSTKRFADLMNEKAKDLGCKNTHFENVHGLPHNDHYTTAEDLSIIAADAFKNDTVKTIVGTQSKKLGYFNVVIENSNKLLDKYEYAEGMKTGFTKAAGRCLVSAATKDGITLIAVTLNAPDDWNDHIKMLDYGFSRVGLNKAVSSGTYSAEIPTLNGCSPAKLINTQSLLSLTVDGKPIPFTIEEALPKILFAPIEAGKTAGKLKLKINGKYFSAVSLAVSETVNEKFEEMTFGERFLDIFMSIFYL